MLYRFARRYDEWPGEKYSGSGARGAIKAWHKHGVCSNKLDEFWEKMRFEGGEDNNCMNLVDDARSRPLGAYLESITKILLLCIAPWQRLEYFTQQPKYMRTGELPSGK
ncbi:MAG: hypothetical protein IPG99_06325 [Ignavibacteria bacterium]|nr:hypothetical protein [Ignavibacteria bacterium]